MSAPAEEFNYLVVSDLHLSDAERNPAGRFFHSITWSARSRMDGRVMSPGAGCQCALDPYDHH